MSKGRKSSALVCVLTAFALVGCGQAKVPDVVDTTSIAITDKGAVTSYLVEEFDKDYYDISELTSMAITEAAEYNTRKQVGDVIPVTVDKVESLAEDGQKVRVIHKYDSTATFMDYNGSELFYGTVQQAVDAGYDLEQQLTGVKDGTALTKEELLEDGEKHIVITNEKAKIYCPRSVAYISEGASYEADGSVDTTQAQETVVILMKK